jgi:hypothetical protein
MNNMIRHSDLVNSEKILGKLMGSGNRFRAEYFEFLSTAGKYFDAKNKNLGINEQVLVKKLRDRLDSVTSLLNKQLEEMAERNSVFNFWLADSSLEVDNGFQRRIVQKLFPGTALEDLTSFRGRDLLVKYLEALDSKKFNIIALDDVNKSSQIFGKNLQDFKSQTGNILDSRVTLTAKFFNAIVVKNCIFLMNANYYPPLTK